MPNPAKRAAYHGLLKTIGTVFGELVPVYGS